MRAGKVQEGDLVQYGGNRIRLITCYIICGIILSNLRGRKDERMPENSNSYD